MIKMRDLNPTNKFLSLKKFNMLIIEKNIKIMIMNIIEGTEIIDITVMNNASIFSLSSSSISLSSLAIRITHLILNGIDRSKIFNYFIWGLVFVLKIRVDK